LKTIKIICHETIFHLSIGLDARGVGPRIMLITAPVLIAAIVFEIQSAPFSDIVFMKNNIVKTAGWVWLIIGIAALVASMAQFISNFPKGQLITKGMYSCSRNPIYACWIVLILPAVGVICSNWVFFAAAFVMCAATIFLVKDEEAELLQCYGKQYFEYKKKVGRIIGFL
jgi:protein-S-isoprenylcysteine O-methyltransferase Ste14